jgi:hypothetical protein
MDVDQFSGLKNSSLQARARDLPGLMGDMGYIPTKNIFSAMAARI